MATIILEHLLDLKRHTSFEQPLQVAKRARRAAKRRGPLDLATIPQSQSSLLCLPREVRDQIYVDAFGSATMNLRHRDLELEVLNNRCTYADKEIACTGLHGLPHWVQTCKQMCTEALETVSRTRTFRITGKVSKARSATLGSCANSLVFRRGGIRIFRYNLRRLYTTTELP